MRKLTAALSAFALAVTLSACGNESTGGDAAPENKDSSGGTEQAAGNLAELAKSIGDQTAETSTAHMVFTADAAGQKVTGEGDLKVGDADAAMTMSMSTPEGDVAFVFLDGIMYIDVGQEIEPGKTWIKIDPNGNDPVAKALAGVSDQLRQNADPRQTLAQFEKAGTITSQEEGVEVNGEETTHYTITVDVEKLAAEQQDPTLKQALEQAEMKDFPVELWVNGDDLPVRIKIDMPMADPATGKATAASVQVDYTKWGEPVEIAAPPAAQVAEMPQG